MDGLLQEGHSDALLVVDFEAATQETIQEDEELAMAFTAYQQARHRLSKNDFATEGSFLVDHLQVETKGSHLGSKDQAREKVRLHGRVAQNVPLRNAS